MPEHYEIDVTVNYADGQEHELDLGTLTLTELPNILARLYDREVSSLVVCLVRV